MIAQAPRQPEEHLRSPLVRLMGTDKRWPRLHKATDSGTRIGAYLGLAVLINLLLFYFIYRLVTPRYVKPPRYEPPLPVEFIRWQKAEDARELDRQPQPPPKPKPQRAPALAKMAIASTQQPPVQKPGIAAPQVDLPSAQIRGGPYLANFQGDPMGDALAFSGALELDTNAVPVVRIDPPYPARALRAGIQGRVTVEFTITAAGGVKDPVIAEADPPGIFDRAVLAVITKWKFKPRISAGVPIARRARQVVEFSMQD